ncbi:lantibiotic dehydratase [Streptomyces sp. NPDC088755]|uniref:lantibiotic dehydratase n=1 Tax=Streptomyces sp. NPDC088755 TaxID=3365888 RepID=UPI00382BE058
MNPPVPELQMPAALPAPDGRAAPLPRVAPGALVRTTLLRLPAEPGPAAAFRAALAELVVVEQRLTALAPVLGDALYASRADHTAEFHRDVVLPLRRAVHNGRDPRPALLRRLDGLPDRLPELRAWLGARGRRDELLTALRSGTAPALAAGRSVLAGLCRDPWFLRAASFTSADLLRAVVRAGQGPADRRARKEEAGVLRHAARAVARTTPLSAFTGVGWGVLPPPSGGEQGADSRNGTGLGADSCHGAALDADSCHGAALDADSCHGAALDAGSCHSAGLDAGSRNGTGSGAGSRNGIGSGAGSWNGVDLPLGSSRAVVRPNRTLVDTLFAALATDSRRRSTLPHRMCSSLRLSDGRAAFARSRTSFTAARFLAVEDDEVTLGAAEPLRRLAALCDPPVTLDALAEMLASGAAPETEPGQVDAASAFIRQVCDAGLLVPVEPFDPQDPDPLPRLARWLRGTGAPHDGELALRIDELSAVTGEFGAAEPARRAALLATLRDRWATLLDEVGRPVGAGLARLTVLGEDVVMRQPVRLDGLLDDADHRAVGELAALAEVFDLGPEVRRQVRDSFVARYGRGGVCPHVWDFGADANEAWQRAARAAQGGAPGTDGDRSTAAGGIRHLAALRAELVEAVHRAHDGGGPDDDVVLPDGLVAGLGSRMPSWATRRPVSYTGFLQRAPGGMLCVNHVYGGWGRFSSRFLDSLDPGAAKQQAATVSDALGPGSRVAQVRPVSGFNANLHPLFVPEEIGPDRSYASLGADDVELVHDLSGDEVRVRVKATGEWLDVLYAGVFAPPLLQPRLAPLLMDHPHGITDFGALVPRHITAAPGGDVVRTPRLRHRHLVLRRRRWELAGSTVAALVAELTAEGDVPVGTVARWRVLLGVPDQLYLHAAPPSRGGRVAQDLLRALDRPRPQYVDLGDALHLRCLGKWLTRHPDGVVLEEALPAPARGEGCAAVELVVETYRAGRPAGDAPDALDSLGRWRLRAGVSVTFLHHGVHLRGRITSVTLEGGPGLPVLWSRLAAALASGGDGCAELARTAPPGSPLRAALRTVIGKLLDHDLLVERYGEDAEDRAGPWLGAVAGRPTVAAAALARSRARVLGARPDGPLARAAARALDRAGIPAEVAEAADLPDGRILLIASGPRGSSDEAPGRGAEDRAVAVGVRRGVGFVTPVGSTEQARADADGLAGRLRRWEVRGTVGEHPGLSALLVASAAQRLVCAVAGLRDPSAEAGDARLLPGLPAALVAEQEPLRGEYRSWPGPLLVDADRIRLRADVRTSAEALARVPVLTDRMAGVLDEPEPGALPQLPAALVRCAVGDGVLVAGSARADLARLDAVCRAAELRLGSAGMGLVVGANAEHARGRALRRAASRLGTGTVVRADRRDTAAHGRAGQSARPGRRGANGPVAVPWSPETARHPQALHWWSVLARRLDVDADVAVSRVDVGGGAVFRARVRGRTTPGGPSDVLGKAVEATADDAVAFAALCAVVRVQMAADAPHARHLVTPSGASAALARSDEATPWEDAGWTTSWLAELGGREPDLQEALTDLTGWSPQPWEPPTGAPADVPALWSALRQCGFAVLSARPEHGTHPTTPTGGLR